MKQLSTAKQILAVLVGILLMTGLALVSGCQKSKKKGVVEHRRHYFDWGTDNGWTYSAYVVDEKDLNDNAIPGKPVVFSERIPDQYSNYMVFLETNEYCYWPDKSLEDLGYNGSPSKGTPSETAIGYLGYELEERSSIGGIWTEDPFTIEDIKGSWKNERTGLVIEITSGSAGRGIVREHGTEFSERSPGGDHLKNVVYLGDGVWYASVFYFSYLVSEWSEGDPQSLYLSTDKSQLTITNNVFHRQ